MRSLTVAFLLTAYAFAVQAESFQPGCTLPFEAIKGEDLKIDSQCGIEGAGSRDEKVAENRAKNNLCATGSPASLTFVSFKKLQQKTDEGKANGVNFKANRTLLRNIYTTSDGETVGEGSLVRFVGLVLKADHANFKKNGEAVNCNYKASLERRPHRVRREVNHQG